MPSTYLWSENRGKETRAWVWNEPSGTEQHPLICMWLNKGRLPIPISWFLSPRFRVTVVSCCLFFRLSKHCNFCVVWGFARHPPHGVFCLSLCNFRRRAWCFVKMLMFVNVLDFIATRRGCFGSPSLCFEVTHNFFYLVFCTFEICPPPVKNGCLSWCRCLKKGNILKMMTFPYMSSL